MSSEKQSRNRQQSCRPRMSIWARLLLVGLGLLSLVAVGLLVLSRLQRTAPAETVAEVAPAVRTAARTASPTNTARPIAPAIQAAPSRVPATQAAPPTAASLGAALAKAEKDDVTRRARQLAKLLAAGKAVQAEGKVAQAVLLFRKACLHTPDSPAAWLGLIEACRRAGDFTQAWRACESALGSVIGDQTEVHRAFAHLALDCGRMDAAVAQAAEVLAKQPDDAGAHLVTAFSLLGLGRSGVALEHARKAAKRAPDSLAAQVALGRALADEEQPSAAVEVLRRVLATSPGSPHASLALARALRQLGDDEGARKTLAMVDKQLGAEEGRLVEVILEPDGDLPAGALGSGAAVAVEAAVERAELLVRAGKVKEGIAEFGRLATENPELYSIHYRFAELTLLSGQAEAARKLAEAQLARASGADASPHVILARVFLKKRLFGLAREECQRALAGTLDRRATLSARKTLAVACNRSGDPKQAVAEMQEYLKGRPDDRAAICRLSVFLLGAEDPDTAFKTLRAAATRFPEDPLFPGQEALLRLKTGDREGATAALRKAVELDAKGVRIYLHLASLLLGKNQTAEALAVARLAKEKAPSAHLVADTLAWCLIRNDRLDEALPHIQFALSILPAAPRYRYHHAVLFHRQQKSDQAAGELRTALASPRQFPERQAAEKLLATLTGKKP